MRLSERSRFLIEAWVIGILYVVSFTLMIWGLIA
jgi:hypothetical protein